MLKRGHVRSPRRRPDDGAVAVVVAIVVVGVVIPLMALVVDLGLSRMLSQQSRGAADAGALAAAALQPHPTTLAEAEIPNGAVAQAKALVEANLPAPDVGWDTAWRQCVDPAPLSDVATVDTPGNCISFDFIKKHVRVTVPSRIVPTVFSGLDAGSSLHASATTTATWGVDGPPACGLCVLDNYAGGRAAVQVTGGDAAIGGDLAVANGGSLNVTGGLVTYGYGRTFTPGGTVSPFPPVVRAAPDDVYKSSLPTIRTATPNYQSVYGQPSLPAPPSGPCPAGIYQDISTCTAFTVNGTYFITGTPGSNVQVKFGADATGVTLFFTCSASSGGFVVAAQCPSAGMPSFVGTSVPGSQGVTVTGPGNGSGLAIVFDEGLSGQQGLIGADKLTVKGDMYGPSIQLGSNGTSTTTVIGHVMVGSILFQTSSPTSLQVTVPPPTPVPDGPVRLARTS